MISNIKSIFIKKVENKIFFRGDSQTTKGMSMSYGPYFMIEDTLDSLILGTQILRTFEECTVGIPHPEDLTKLSVLEKADPYSTSMEAKLLKKLKKTNKDIRLSITYDGAVYEFHPYRVTNKYCAEGIDCDPLKSSSDPMTLGNTLLEAFTLCK